MNTKRIITISAISYIFSLILAYLGISLFIKNKDNMLRSEIEDAITEIFGGRSQCFVDVEHHSRQVVYKEIDIPQRISSASDTISYPPYDISPSEKWQAAFGDLYCLYQIANINHGFPKDGWNLVRICNRNIEASRFSVEIIFPYAVGFKRQDYEYFYNFAPTVEVAVDEAYDFFTTSPKSIFLSDDPHTQYYDGVFVRGSYQKIMDKIYDAENEYYWIKKDENPAYYSNGTRLFGLVPNWSPDGPMAYTYMHNGYYRVFVGVTQPSTWSIYRKPWQPELLEKRRLLLWWSIGLALLTIGVIVLLVLKSRRDSSKYPSSRMF